jgi:hypothetical protein
LKGVNSKILTINSAEIIFDSIEGVFLKKKVFEKVIKKIDTIIDENIMRPAYEKIHCRLADEVISSLFELKNWAENIPYLEEIIDENILKILVLVNK